MPVGSGSPMMATTRAPCSTISGTRTSSTRCATPKWRRTASRIFGANWRRQARDRFPLDHLGIRLRLALRQHLLNQLDAAIDLLVRHLFERVPVLDLVLARHQKRAYLHVGRRLIPRDSRDHF